LVFLDANYIKIISISLTNHKIACPILYSMEDLADISETQVYYSSFHLEQNIQ